MSENNLYKCSACGDFIPSSKARIHCQPCHPSYDLCANCFVVQNFSQNHQVSHYTVVVTMSGQLYPPPPPSVSATPPLPQRPPPTPKRPISMGQQPAPPPPPPQAQAPPSYQQHTPLPPPPPSAPREPLARPIPSWQPLFGQDLQPTPIFVALMQALFARLDPQRTGTLRPEVYSSFLDSQGYPLEADVCTSPPVYPNKKPHSP